MLTIAIGGNLSDYNRKREAELEKIKQEHQQLLEEKQLLEKQKVELEKANEQLKKQTKIKAQVRVASATYPGTTQCLAWIKEAGITDTRNAIILINRESGCRVNATNKSSGAYGIGQALPATKMASFGADYRTNPITQLRWMNHYCIKRYGSWEKAVAHSNLRGWY